MQGGSLNISTLVTLIPLLAQIKHNQWKTREELEEIQQQKLRALVAYASKHVPYYRKSLKGLGMEELPLTKKQDVKRCPESFVGDRYKKRSIFTIPTSGSTGIPLTTYYDYIELSCMFTLRYHLYTEAGVSPFDLQANITYDTREPTILHRLGLFRRHYLFESNPPEKNLKALKSLRPDFITSYPSTLAPLAHANLISGKEFSVKRIFSSAEMLSEKARELITDSFSCSLYNRYGSIETGSIAWECEKGSMHIYSDSIIVEILDDHGDPVKEGKRGNVVLTPLWRYSMPFIRYCVGDMAALGTKCKCGRGLHVLKSIKGRNNDFLVLPSGRLLMGAMIGVKLRRLDGILQFQTVQESRDLLCVRVAPMDRNRFTEEQIKDAVQSVVPEPMDIEVEMVDKIPSSPRGKVCDFISKVKH